MNILEKITLGKYREVEERRSTTAASLLEQSPYFGRKANSLKAALDNPLGRHGIIAEFKRKSPSKGIFNESFDPVEITKGYISSGATALSILTDGPSFGGSKEDLMQVRNALPDVPILRKDFMVDEYQILEAKAWGADAILLIAASTPPVLLHRLAKLAKSLGLDTLLEIHEIEELQGNLSEYIDVIGVNNRNLKDFTVDIERSVRAIDHIPPHYTRISESGISKPETVRHLKEYGFKGFLMGEAFMQTPDPVEAIQRFIKSI